MLIGVVIPSDRDQPIYKHEFADDLDNYQDVVGGLIEAVDLPSQSATIWVNEEGKLEALAINRRATALLWETEPQWRSIDVLVGNVLITGLPDARGETQSIPEALLGRLVDSDSDG